MRRRVDLGMTRSFLLGLLLAPLAVPCVGANSRGPFPIFGASRSICINIPWQVRSIVEPSYPLQVDTLRAVHRFRGGAEDVADDDDDDDEESDYEDEDDGDFSKFADVAEDDDFAEETWIDRSIQAYHKTPPFTKAYLTASFVAASTSFLLGQKDFPSALVLDWGKVVSKFQIWRPFTAFLNFGPLGLGYAMTVNFVWVYMSTLERLCHNAPYDFWIMIAFGMFSMLVGYPIMGLNGRFLGHNISTYLVYIWSRYHEGAVVSMFDLFTTRAELLPWFFLAQTFLLEGELPVLDLLGIAFGHVYYHLKTIGTLKAPDFIKVWYEESPSAQGIREKYKVISSDYQAI